MTAHREWLEAWKGTWQSLCLFVVNSAVKDHLELDGYDCYICTVCGDELPEHRIRDHFLINCPAMRKIVHLPLHHMFDLRALLHVPCGRLAESKLYYLGEILAFFKSKKGFVTHEPPKISLDMTGLLEIDGGPFMTESKLDTTDPALCKGSEFAEMLQSGQEDERLTGKNARRRYLRSLETISKRVHDNMLIGDFEQRQIWIETLTRAAGAAKFLLDEAKTYEKHSREARPEDESNEME